MALVQHSPATSETSWPFKPGTLWRCAHDPSQSFLWPYFTDQYWWCDLEAQVPSFHPTTVIPVPWEIYMFFPHLLTRIASFLDPAVDEDRVALLSLSTTCASWRLAVLPVLFRKITISRLSQVQGLLELLQANPSLAWAIKEIQAKFSDNRRDHFDMANLRAVLAMDQMEPEVVVMEHLNKLNVNTPCQLSAVSRSIISVRSLVLRFCTFNSVATLEQFVVEFPCLEELSLDVVAFTLPPTPEDLRPLSMSPHNRGIGLRRLTIGRYCDLLELVQWCFNRLNIDVLVDLAFLSLDIEDLYAVKDLLVAMRPRLKSLTIGLTFNGLPLSFYNILTKILCLGCFEALETLRLRLLDLQPDSLRWVTKILSTATPGPNARLDATSDWFSPKTVIFDIWLFNSYQLEGQEWDHIVRTLGDMALSLSPQPLIPGVHAVVQRQRGRLEKVTFIQWGTLAVDRAALAIRHRLAFLLTLGVDIEVKSGSMVW